MIYNFTLKNFFQIVTTRVWHALVRPALTVLRVTTATTWTTQTWTGPEPALVRHDDFRYDICCCLMSLKTDIREIRWSS